MYAECNRWGLEMAAIKSPFDHNIIVNYMSE